MIYTLVLVAHLASAFVIYGEDDRKDFYDLAEDQQKLMMAVAAMVESKHIVGRDGESELKGPTLRDRNRCEEERFINQPTVARCSGFLVSDRVLLTAAHCVPNNRYCEGFDWVFGYNLKEEGQNKFPAPKKNVYRCEKILKKYFSSTGADYAYILLDRKVEERAPLAMSREKELKVGTPIAVMGHPSGLPSKFAAGAEVGNVDNPEYFEANLDTYGGNSGSPVINTDTEEVVGILVRGERDYVWTSNNCWRSNVLPQDKYGESATNVAVLPLPSEL